MLVLAVLRRKDKLLAGLIRGMVPPYYRGGLIPAPNETTENESSKLYLQYLEVDVLSKRTVMKRAGELRGEGGSRVAGGNSAGGAEGKARGNAEDSSGRNSRATATGY